MKKNGSIGERTYEIVRDDARPEVAEVIYPHPSPLLATMALNSILDGLNDTYKGVKRVVFRPADGSDADATWKRHHLGNYIYTGIVVTNDYSIDAALYDYDIVTAHHVPADVRTLVISRYCKRTGLSRMDVFLSESMTHIPRVVMEDAVLEDFRRQAAAYFANGDETPLLDRYGEQRIPGKTFAQPFYAMLMSARLSIGSEVDLLQVRRFLVTARKHFLNSSDRQSGTTDAALRRDSKLLDKQPGRLCWVENFAMTREEARAIYNDELDNYRDEESEWQDFFGPAPFEDYEEDRDEYLLT